MTRNAVISVLFFCLYTVSVFGTTIVLHRLYPEPGHTQQEDCKE